VIRRSIELTGLSARRSTTSCEPVGPSCSSIAARRFPISRGCEQIETVRAQVGCAADRCRRLAPEPARSLLPGGALDPHRAGENEFATLHADPKLAAELDASLDGKIAERAAGGARL
jgi:hypothetical protein